VRSTGSNTSTRAAKECTPFCAHTEAIAHCFTFAKHAPSTAVVPLLQIWVVLVARGRTWETYPMSEATAAGAASAAKDRVPALASRPKLRLATCCSMVQDLDRLASRVTQQRTCCTLSPLLIKSLNGRKQQQGRQHGCTRNAMTSGLLNRGSTKQPRPIICIHACSWLISWHATAGYSCSIRSLQRSCNSPTAGCARVLLLLLLFIPSSAVSGTKPSERTPYNHSSGNTSN
jgi:hypothetical protein